MRPPCRLAELVVLNGALGGCGQGVDVPAQPAPLTVIVEPAADTDSVPAVLRFRLADAGRIVPSDVRLFEGQLSEYHVGRVTSGEVPSTLDSRAMPLVGWRRQDELTVAPVRPLANGAIYTLAALGVGELSVVSVEAYTALLGRLWPPAGSRGGGHWVFCGDVVVPPPGSPPEWAAPATLGSALPLTLAPSNIGAIWSAGIDADGAAADRCGHVSLTGRVDDGSWLLPPPRVGGVALEPAPVVFGSLEAPEPLSCSSPAVPFGVGCAFVLDDRAVVRSVGQPTLWAIEAPGRLDVFPADAAGVFVVRGLSPSSRNDLVVSVYDLSGGRRRYSLAITTVAARAHPVLNEVLANPSGQEPDQEWVEIINGGSTHFDLAGYVLEDAGGEVMLPSAELAPGEHVLVVSESYDSASEVDVAPGEGTRLVTVPRLAQSGLSNSGEALRLVSPSGEVVSRFPATPPPKPGVSVARRDAWTLDDDLRGFGYHAAPGQSPGEPNALE